MPQARRMYRLIILSVFTIVLPFDQIQAALLYRFSFSVSLHHLKINLEGKIHFQCCFPNATMQVLFLFFFPDLSVICELFTQSCVSIKYQINNMLRMDIVP